MHRCLGRNAAGAMAGPSCFRAASGPTHTGRKMTAWTGAIVLRGGEVELRPLGETDAPALWAAAEGLALLHPYSFVPKDETGAGAYVAAALAEKARGERYPFAIVWRGALAGTTSFLDFAYWPRAGLAKDVPAAVEIGATWLARHAQRTDCNTTAKLLLLRFAFETWRCERVSLRTDERNQRSRNAIERIGARFEGIRRAEKLGADGAVRNSAYYSIVAGEWPQVRSGLENRLAAQADA